MRDISLGVVITDDDYNNADGYVHNDAQGDDHAVVCCNDDDADNSTDS